MWSNFKFLHTADVEKFLHMWHVWDVKMSTNMQNLWYFVIKSAIYAILSWNLSCHDLHTFVCRKIYPKIALVERKWQIWGLHHHHHYPNHHHQFRPFFQTSTATPWYFWEDFRSSAEKSTATPWYFWEDFRIGRNKHRHPLIYIFLRWFLVSSKVFSESDTFSIPNFLKPILFSIPKIFETDTDTFFDTKIFQNRYRYH